MSFSVSTAEVGGGCSGARPRPPSCCWMGRAGAGPPALLPHRSPRGGPCISLAPKHASAFHTFTHLLVCILFLVYLPSHPLALWEACWGPTFLPVLLPVLLHSLVQSVL